MLRAIVQERYIHFTCRTLPLRIMFRDNFSDAETLACFPVTPTVDTPLLLPCGHCSELHLITTPVYCIKRTRVVCVAHLRIIFN
jgi:hypothetical protein